MKHPLVSIIIRTCQRPETLKKALISIREQSYSPIQVIIVEDGQNSSERMLEKEFKDLDLIYKATGEKIGRSAVGNIGLKLATGEYLNFLDDDDAFLQDHVEVLVHQLLIDSNLAAYSVAEEYQVKNQKVKKRLIRYRQPFNRLLLYTFNYIEIQCIMFHRSLFETLGGFDENLDTLEDWDLWVRYSTLTDFSFINKVTSYYHTPYSRNDKSQRASHLKDYLQPLHNKFENYKLELSVEEINKEMQYVIREYKNRGIVRYLRMFVRVVFLGER